MNIYYNISGIIIIIMGISIIALCFGLKEIHEEKIKSFVSSLWIQVNDWNISSNAFLKKQFLAFIFLIFYFIKFLWGEKRFSIRSLGVSFFISQLCYFVIFFKIYLLCPVHDFINSTYYVPATNFKITTMTVNLLSINSLSQKYSIPMLSFYFLPILLFLILSLLPKFFKPLTRNLIWLFSYVILAWFFSYFFECANELTVIDSDKNIIYYWKQSSFINNSVLLFIFILYPMINSFLFSFFVFNFYKLASFSKIRYMVISAFFWITCLACFSMLIIIISSLLSASLDIYNSWFMTPIIFTALLDSFYQPLVLLFIFITILFLLMQIYTLFSIFIDHSIYSLDRFNFFKYRENWSKIGLWMISIGASLCSINPIKEFICKL